MELVLFDLDGTLLDGGGLPAAMLSTCEALARDADGVGAADLVAANTAAWQRLWPEVEDDYMLGGRAGDEVTREAWRETLHACGLDDPRLLDRATAEWERQQRVSFRLYDDALPALDALAAAGLRTGLVTNGAGAVQRLKLDATGLAGRLDPIVVSGEVGVQKPHPDVFGIALARAGVGAAATAFVGDSRWHDLPGAIESGIRTVWLDRDGASLAVEGPEPDATIATLAELPALLLGPLG